MKTFISSAQSGDITFIHQIQDSLFHGCVHSVFTHTFNIQCFSSGDLFTVASYKVDNAPNTLVIRVEDFLEIGLAIYDLVYVENGILYIGNTLSISLENTKGWQNKLPEYPLNETRLINNINVAKQFIVNNTPKMMIDSTSNKEVTSLLEKNSKNLLAELLNGKVNEAKNYAVKMIGLGFGLTPSGDDFLVGLFTILNMPNSPFYKYRFFCEEVLKKAESLTNDISLIALKKASTGQVRESISRLLYFLINGNDEEMISSLKIVLNIGASSGKDIVSGLIAGIELNVLENKICQY